MHNRIFIVISRVVVVILLILAVCFAVVAFDASLLDYNENGVYFDGSTTHDTDTIVGFGFLAALLFAAAAIVALVARRLRN